VQKEPIEAGWNFRKELVAEDLPESDNISIRVAAAWLAGIPANALQNFEAARPSHQMGRSEQSMRFWRGVFQHIIALEDGPAPFPWLDLISNDAVRKIPGEERREETEKRVLKAARRYVSLSGQSFDQLAESWSNHLRYQIKKIWALRDALGKILAELPSLLPDDATGKIVREAMDGRRQDATGVCISLRTGSLDLVNWPGHPSSRFSELWRQTGSVDFRETLIGGLFFDRSALVDFFVVKPDQDRDNWIGYILGLRWWPVELAVAYLAFDGECQQLHKNHEASRQIGYGNFSFVPLVVNDSDDVVAVNCTPATEQLTQKLQAGSISAKGLLKPALVFQEIDEADWFALNLFSQQYPDKLFAAENESDFERSWHNITVSAAEIRQMCPPIKPSTGRGSIGLFDETRQIKLDTPDKQQLWKLIEFLEREADSANYRTHSKSRVLENLFPENTERSRQRLWDAANYLLPEHLVDVWGAKGRKRETKPTD